MKACGIIAEYNPFHNGHMYHLNRSLELSGADVSIAVVSGNFTERGELALLDKWKRAEIAVKNGVNLVVEMPTLFACNNAGYFAKAGVEILEALQVENISFGIESDSSKIIEIADILIKNEEVIEAKIKDSVKAGLSYPRAREEAISSIAGKDLSEDLSKPNNILAFEYLKNIKASKPLMIDRKGTGYNDKFTNGELASASLVREMLLNHEDISKYVPSATLEILNNSKLTTNEKFYDIFIQKALTLTENEMNLAFGAEEGLGSIIKRDFRKWSHYDDIILSLKSKRYTDTRIRRVLVNIMLGITKEDVKTAKNYIRILAFDEKGASYLKEVKKSGKCSLPIITNINKELNGLDDIKRTIEFDIKASDVYNLASGYNLYDSSDYVKAPVKLGR